MILLSFLKKIYDFTIKILIFLDIYLFSFDILYNIALSIKPIFLKSFSSLFMYSKYVKNEYHVLLENVTSSMIRQTKIYTQTNMNIIENIRNQSF